MPSENFRNWACSFSGCDGGNINATMWLCGIEWGGGGADDGIYYRQTLPAEIERGAVQVEQGHFDWNDSVRYPYGRSFAKLYASMLGKDVDRYMDLIKDLDGTELFKLNMYPIAFDSTNTELWHTNGLDEITGFSEKHLFQTWCFFNRFPFFSDLRSRKNPRLIIGTGINYLRDFFLPASAATDPVARRSITEKSLPTQIATAQ